MRTMNRISKLGVVFFTLACAIAAPATVLNFDTDTTGYSGSIDWIVPGYGGFTWTNFGLIDGDDVHVNSGYFNGTVSGEYVAFNSFGTPAGMSVANPNLFDFNGAYITAAWNTGLTVQVDGYLNSVLVGTQTIIVDTTGPTWWNVGLNGIDELIFSSYGGTNAGLGNPGEQFAMDNFTYDFHQPIPEPASLTLLGLGLAGLVARTRRSRTKG